MEFIKSASNSRIKAVARLKTTEGRRESNTFVAEGVRIVLDAPVAPIEVYATEDHEDVLRKFEGIANTFLVSREAYEKMSDTKSPQGVLAVFSRPNVEVKIPDSDHAIVLDGVSDPGNVGTIIRTAGACGFGDVYLINCADCFSPKVVRSSMGGVFRVRLSVGDVKSVFDALKEKNFTIYSLDMGGENVFECKAKLPCALVVGSEARGVSDYTRENADGVLALPMVNDTESLNAGVSASTLMYVIKFSNK
ncbi:MAG: RNA methyltransferase [Clostridia bacterium]|nr:RNA methyltransferase [Clostridia bacterium]